MRDHTQYRNVRRDPESSGSECETANMAYGLNCIGKLWAVLSFIGMGLSCVGFFVPFWLEGTMGLIGNHTPTYLGLWRRCHYFRISEESVMEIVKECGRYSTFMDIPSIWWQIGTVLIGVGCGLTVLVAFAAIFGCCFRDIITNTTIKVARSLQFFAGLLIGVGCVFYPLGWDSREVQQVCGQTADKFQLGNCQIGWALLVTAAGAGTILMCVTLTCCSVRKQTPCRYRPRKQHTSQL